MRKEKGLYACLSILVIVSALSVHAAPGDPPPTAFLERAIIVGVGKNVHVTRVPTQDINGVVRYFDVEISLSVNDEGVVDAATFISAESPQFLTNAFVAGNYDDGQSGTCTLGVSTALGGRMAGALACRDANGQTTLNANWVTGPIAGHPFETELIAAGIEQNTGAENVAWGQGSSTFAYNCFAGGDIISAHQAGNVLAINNFGNTNRIGCNYSFTLVEP
jgi:hypothetical protein